MQQPHNIFIHEFEVSGPPYFDADGDQMLGFYFQLTDVDESPISEMIGPYSYRKAVEKAALKAFKTRDF